ncbi:MAG: acetate kinase [Blastochloris viridis]|uniref:Acetate kinase n=1 Tax=Blastochloris viridis TaxID=1079 RepID=A0A6N4RAQ0_BLAVI|nr:MAG: acetate kinase [Blastochloris viridis]
MKMLLTLNTGSSSVKFRLFGLSENLPLVAGGKVSSIGEAPVFKAHLENGPTVTQSLTPSSSHEDAVLTILEWLKTSISPTYSLTGIAHRIVHGGEYIHSVRLTPDDMVYLHGLEPLAPLHQPHNLAGVRLLTMHLPGVAHYGCFDTAFHAGRSELHTTFALPEKIRSSGIRRYGFHGLSYNWISHTLHHDFPHLREKKVVAAHLGNGASLCAMHKGRSVDTTMGFTALDGLPMGTRCGALDPGVVLHLQRDMNYSASEMEQMLYEESGLKGLSGISNDVQTLLAAGTPRAMFALDYFVHKVAQNIAAQAVSLGGMDALVLTGGIGENNPDLCKAILEKIAFLPPFETLVIPANEERWMALDIYEHFGKDM